MDCAPLQYELKLAEYLKLFAREVAIWSGVTLYADHSSPNEDTLRAIHSSCTEPELLSYASSSSISFSFRENNIFFLKETKQFHDDFEKTIRSNSGKNLFKQALQILMSGYPLPPSFYDQSLIKAGSNCRACCLTKDLFLIYRFSQDSLILIRSGDKTDLFLQKTAN